MQVIQESFKIDSKTENAEFMKGMDTETNAGINQNNWSQQLCLVQECNHVLTYTGQKFAFCRGGLDENPTFLPALSKILYGANLPIRSWTHVVSSSPTSESE